MEGGLAATTVESVAARAKASKVTIYKWWPSRGVVAVDAYFHRFGQTYSPVDTADVAADLILQIRQLVRAFRGRAGEIMAELIGQAQSDPALAATLRAGWLQPRREATAALLQRAVDRSQHPAGRGHPDGAGPAVRPGLLAAHDAPRAARRWPGR